MSTRFDRSELREILKGSAAKRLDYFRKKRISHSRLLTVRDQLCSTIELRAGSDLAIVAGPTGVGKSTLVDILQDQVQQGKIDCLKSDPGCIPVIAVEAPAPETTLFGWKDFYVRIMEALGEPLIDKKLSSDALQNPAKVNAGHPSLSTAEMRRITEKCLRHRKTSVLVVDEAQHMFRIGSGRRLLDILETLKSFASYGTVFVVLTGTYDLTNALELNGQLGRRTALINFARYEREEGFGGFLSALKGFQDRLPVSVPPNLLSHADYMLEATLGLVGIMKNHLERALALALSSSCDTVTVEHLKTTALTPRARLEIAREIQRGEEFFKETADAEAAVRKIIGLEPLSEPRAASANSKRRVGERNPRRDPIGIPMEIA